MKPEAGRKMRPYAALLGAARLDRIAYQMGRARKSTDPDSVHDLRVSIRRFFSCLHVFSDFFPAGAAKKIRKRLRDVMTQAGEVRDRDIAIELGRKAGLEADSPVLVGLAQQRKRAAKGLSSSLKPWAKRTAFDKWRERLKLEQETENTKRHKTPWEPSRTATENARDILPDLTDGFFRAGREVVHSPPTVESLHELRLKVKLLRYTLELFRFCCGPGLERRLEALKQMQDHLGSMNDCQMSASLAQKPALRELAGTQDFVKFLDSKAADEQAAFIQHWKEIFDAPGQSRWWTDYLRRAAARASG